MISFVKPSAAQRGFTLIELVVVIVILGILAAFAVPKFMGLEKQARIASVSALEGTLRSAATMAYGIALATGQTAATGSITVNAVAVPVAFGYPTAASIGTLVDPSIINAAAGRFTNTNGVFTLNGATTTAQCKVTYTAARNANTPATAASVTNGC